MGWLVIFFKKGLSGLCQPLSIVYYVKVAERALLVNS